MKTATAFAAGFGGFVLIMVVVGLLVGYPIVWLWNWLMPQLFPTTEIAQITFWQALGLWLLCGFLFKGGSQISGKEKA